MQNIIINVRQKFRYDRLRNDRALGNGKSDNNNKNDDDEERNYVGSAGGPVSGSKTGNQCVKEVLNRT